MLISFLITSQSKDDMLLKTLLSLKKQTSDDFEIIIFNDEASPKPEHEHHNLFLTDVFEDNKTITLVNNSRFQGHSFNWNLGINIARGEYIAIIKEGDLLEPNYVSTISKILESYADKKIDIIQIQKKLNGLMKEDYPQFLEEDKLYSLPENQEVFAYIQETMYGKLFRKSYLQDFRLKFRNSVRYDALFVYKALGHARNFYNSSAVLMTHKVSVLKYSAFDLANQWPHILNYYRRIGIYKDLKNELNYAYFYNLIYNFLLLIKHFRNPQLYRKALKFVDTKLGHRLEDFQAENQIFQQEKDEEFTSTIKNFPVFIKNEWKSAR